MIGWAGFFAVRGVVRGVAANGRAMVTDFENADARGKTFAAVTLVTLLTVVWITGGYLIAFIVAPVAGLIACTLVFTWLRPYFIKAQAREKK